MNEDLGSLDWGQGEVKQVIVQQLMEGLTLVDPQGKVIPGVADRWENKGSIYRFHLRRNAKWSNGQKLCAGDFVYGWNRIQERKIASSYSNYFSDIKSFSAESCDVLRVETVRNISFLPALLSHWVFYPVKQGSGFTEKDLVTNGPYKLKEWKRDQYFLLEKNPNYTWTVRSNAPDILRALVVSDDSTALALFEDGKIDFLRDLPIVDRIRLQKREEYREFKSWIVYYLGFRSDVPVGLRCAVAAALPTQEIPKLLNGGALPAEKNFLPADFLPHKKSTPPLFQVSAKQTHSLEILYYSKQAHIPLMEWVQARLKLSGIEASVAKLEEKTYWSRLRSNAPEVFLSGTTAAYPHPYTFLSEFLPGSGGNWGAYNSKVYQDFVAQGQEVKAQKQLVEKDCAIVPLYFRTTTALIKKGWRGIVVNPMGYTYFKDAFQ